MVTQKFLAFFDSKYGHWVTKCGNFYCYSETGNVYALGVQGFQEPRGKWDEESGSIIWNEGK